MIFAPPRCLANAASRLCSAKISAPKIFANRPWRKKVPRTNREVKSRELNIVFAPLSPPGPPRFNQNAAQRLCPAKISVPKIFANQPWRKKVPRTNREVKSHELNIVLAPLSPPRVAIKTLRSADASAKISVPKIFANQPWRKKVPRTNRERNELAIICGPPRCDQNAARRRCVAKISSSTKGFGSKVPQVSVSKIFANQVGRRRFQRHTANPYL